MEEHRLRVFDNCVEVNIWTQEGGSSERLEKAAKSGASQLVLFTKYY
jgi:hypothetical protein